MKRFILLLLAAWTLYAEPAFAQSRTISGRVFSEQDGSYIPGATVVLKGTTVGTSTDMEGRYTLPVPGDGGTLVFSFIGLQKQEMPIGNQSEINVKLLPDSKQLTEVVVTALGFKESADKLAATTSKIDGNSIAKSGEGTVISGMAGKASGVQVTRAGGDPGAGSFIQIRGMSTITGNSQPLIVVDGIPISNTNEGGTSGGVVQQSRLNDINPNDIASMQILKGASAAALWGSRAANGVIIITTKKGAEGKLSITFNSTYSLDEVNRYHPLQTTFGQGVGGVYSPTASNSWGDKIADRPGGADELNTSGAYFQAADGTLYYPIVKKNSRDVFSQSNYDQVFRTGSSWDNGLSMSGGNEKSNFFFSIGDLKQNGVLNGNSDYRRTSFRLNTERKLNDILRISTNSTYIRSDANQQQRGNNLSGAPVGLLRTSPDFDITDYKGSYYASPTASPILNRQRSYRNYLGANANPINNNSLWALNEQLNKSLVNRFVNSVELSLKPVEWFDLTARGGYDTYTDQRVNYFPVNDNSGSGVGRFQEQITREGELSADLFGRVTKDIGQDFTASYILGFNINDRQYYNIGGVVTNFIIDNGPINFANGTSVNRTPTNTRTHVRNTRLYNTLGLSAYNTVFLNLAAAAESGSAFGENSNKTFYYPSADVAWIFSQLGFLRNSPTLSFGKLRASFGVVGVQPLPYKTNTIYESVAFSHSPFGDNIVGSQYGNGAFLQSSQQGDDQLRPERKTEYEIGADLRFFNGLVRGGVTYYQNTVQDLLIPVTLSPSTGYVTKYTNAGSLENKGVEMDLSADILKIDQFTWSLNTNYNRNRNKVLSLAGTNSLFLNGIANAIDVRAVEGQPVGVFWYGKYQRDEAGGLVLDENNFPKVDPTNGIIGDPNPDWRGGMGSTFSYGKLTLNVLFETFQGGDFYEGTRGVMYHFGTHADVGNEVTLTQDLRNYAGKLIPAGSTVRGNIHDFGGGPVLLDEAYYTSIGGGFSDVKEHLVSDGSWTRLRHASLSYRLDTDSFRKKTGLQHVEFSLSGRNLLLWTKVQGIDPDTNLTSSPLARGMDYFNSPNTRSFLFSLRVTY